MSGVFLALAVASAHMPSQAQPSGIPSMGVAAGAELSPALERTLGAAIMEQGRRDPSFIADPDISQYLTDVGRRLAASAPGGVGQSITVFALRDPQINAFALPGGYIGVNSGLVAAARNESELASVIAHEIGHVAQRHIARGMTQSSQTSHIMMAALAGALLAALSGSGDLAMGVAAFGQAAAVDRQLGFSRQAEQEADRAGYQMMLKSGYDPRGMAGMFKQLMNASRLNEGMGGSVYTSTHPLSLQRMSDIEARVQGAPATTYRSDPSFWYVRAKLRLLQARDTQARRAALESLQRDAQRADGVEQSAAWYGLAYAAWQAQDTAGAQQALRNAQAGARDSPELAGLAVALATRLGDRAQALDLARRAWSRWPKSQGIALALVQVFQEAGDDRQAVDFLAERIKQWPDVPQLHRLQAQSLERLGDQVGARRAMAVYYQQTGALPTAVEQLQQARNLSSDFYVQSELDVQIRELRQRLESERELLKRFKS
jgi:predicted Zn-dependent protease